MYIFVLAVLSDDVFAERQIQIYLHSIYPTRITIVLTDVEITMLAIIIC
jgi:hypothetical protein